MARKTVKLPAKGSEKFSLAKSKAKKVRGSK